MAKVKNNLLMQGVSGSVGGQIVFSQRNGQTIVSQSPHRSKPPTDKQKAAQRRFKTASIYAKTAMATPSLKEEYEKKAKPGQSAYTCAIADALTPPEIDEIHIKGYTGAIGSLVRVCAEDLLRVDQVHVTISDAQGQIIEDGDAVVQSDGYWWNFTATHELADTKGAKVVVSATDLPGNVTTLETVIK